MNSKILTLFTYHGKSEIIKKGYIGNWRLNKNNAQRCAYAVCVQLHGDWGTPEHHPHEAFLIVKISHISTVIVNDKVRYRIHFNEYAELTSDKKVYGNANPVAYRTAEALGVDFDKLNFVQVADIEPMELDDPEPLNDETLTIPEAKRRLALTLGVSEENITITINH